MTYKTENYKNPWFYLNLKLECLMADMSKEKEKFMSLENFSTECENSYTTCFQYSNSKPVSSRFVNSNQSLEGDERSAVSRSLALAPWGLEVVVRMPNLKQPCMTFRNNPSKYGRRLLRPCRNCPNIRFACLKLQLEP